MNPSSVLGNVGYTCTICDTILVGQARYQQHMKDHRNENNDPMADLGSVLTTSSHTRSRRKPHQPHSVFSDPVNSGSQYEPPPAKVEFKKPYTPAATRVDRKGKKRSHDASSHHLEDNNSNHRNTNFKRTPSIDDSASQYEKSMAPPSRRSHKPMNPYNSRMTIFYSNDPSENLDMPTARGLIRSKNANLAKRSQQQQYRPISEEAKEEMRRILHSSYSNLLATIGSSLSEQDHNKITDLVKKIDKRIRHTMVPFSMRTPYPYTGDLAEEIKTLTEKLDHIIRMTVELELEDFYTKIEIQKLKFQMDHLREISRKDAEEKSALLAITDKEIEEGYDDNSLPNLPPVMRKYRANDLTPSYTDDLLKYTSSSFSLKH